MSLFLKFFLLTAIGIILVSGSVVYAGTLSCSVTTSCSSPNVVIFRMQNTSNSHAGTAAGSTYTNLVCCGGVTGIGNSCSGNYATVLKLSGATNAHARQNSLADYSGSNNACISTPAGPISVGYVAGNSTCATGGYDTTLGSMAATTNSHVGDANAYTGAGNYKICATAEAAIISVTITANGTISYGTLPAGTSKSTIQLVTTPVAKNNGNVAEDFKIKGQNTACQWTLAATAGNNQYVHEYSANSGGSWTPLTTAGDQVLVSNIAVNGTQTADLRVTTPTITNCYNSQSADVTITAYQH